MDDNLLLIIVGATIAFVGVVVWKVRWFLKKVKQAEQAAEEERG